MKIQDFSAFKQSVEKETPTFALVIHKDQTLLKRAETLFDIEGAQRFVMEEFSASAFQNEVETLPFLASKKVVVVRGLETLKAEQLEVIVHYVQDPNPSVTLLILGTTLHPQSKLAKYAQKEGLYFRSGEEKPWEREKRLGQELVGRAKKRGVTLSSDVATHLVKAQAPECLFQELEKIMCYIGQRKQVTLDDVRAISKTSSQQNIWELSDAIYSSDVPQATRIVRNLLFEGMAIFALIGHLRTQFQTGLTILTQLQAGGEAAVTKSFPYLRGQLLQKKVHLLRRFGKSKLQKGFVELYEGEVRAKNQQIDPAVFMEHLVVKVV